MMVSCDMNCCQNGHRWYPEACYFVSLSWERRGDDTQRKTLWFESKHKLAAWPQLSWTVLCAFQEAVSPCLCILPSPWLPPMLRTFRKWCTWYQFRVWSVALVTVKDAKGTALRPTVSCHWEGLATVELGTVLCETWPESLRLASQGGWAEVVQTLQLNSFGSLGDISFDLHSPPSPSHRPAATSFSSHSHTWGPFLDTLIMYRSIPRN